MYCGRCGAQINDDSRFCRHCGAAQEPIESEQPLDGARARKRIAVAGTSDEPATAKPVNTTGRIIGIVAAVLLIITFIGSVISAPVPTGGFEESANTQTDLEAVDKLEQMAAPTTSVAAGAAAWTYATNEDKVRGSKDYTASTTSTNTVHQAPPYDSATTMNMVVRQSAAYGTDVILTISSGQFMCPSYEGCSGTVRFDDGPAQHIRFNGPADNSSDTIFVSGAKQFIAKLRKAKRVVVEKTLYNAGNPQFEFDVHGLVWEH